MGPKIRKKIPVTLTLLALCSAYVGIQFIFYLIDGDQHGFRRSLALMFVVPFVGLLFDLIAAMLRQARKGRDADKTRRRSTRS